MSRTFSRVEYGIRRTESPSTRSDERDAWVPISWLQYAERVARIAVALRNLGLRRGHHAAILAPTSIEWEFAQMACLTLGISVVGVDINYPVEQRNEALRSVAIDVLFVQDEASAGSIPADIAARLTRFVTFEAGSGHSPSGTVSLDELTTDPMRSAGAGRVPTRNPTTTRSSFSHRERPGVRSRFPIPIARFSRR